MYLLLQGDTTAVLQCFLRSKIRLRLRNGVWLSLVVAYVADLKAGDAYRTQHDKPHIFMTD